MAGVSKGSPHCLCERGEGMGVLFCKRANTQYAKEYANEESAAWKSNPRQTADDPQSPQETLGVSKGSCKLMTGWFPRNPQKHPEYSQNVHLVKDNSLPYRSWNPVTSPALLPKTARRYQLYGDTVRKPLCPK